MSTWYRTGTIALTNGSPAVTGTGTAWIANVQIGEGLVAPDGRIYEVTGIASDTALTISPAYLGSTASGQAYAIAPLRGRIAQLLSETSSLLSSFATVRDGIGAGLFPNGTVSTPAIRAAADQDTGLFFPAANTLGWVTGGVERLRIVNADLGLGTTVPAARIHVVGAPLGDAAGNSSIIAIIAGQTGANSRAFQLQTIRNSNGNSWTGTTLRIQSVVDATNNAFIDFGPNGTSDLAFSSGFAAYQNMRWTTSGRLGLGTAVPAVALDIAAGVSRSSNTSYCSHTMVSDGVEAQVAANGGGGSVDLRSVTNHPIRLFTNNAERLRILTSGSVRPGADNTQSLGEASFRWATVFAGSGTINTSDERDKVWRGELDEAELRAAKRITRELGIYQWAESYEKKGKDARLHFGVRAQRAFDILKDEGLDWWRYAWACYDKWDEITEPVFEEVTVKKTHIVQKPEERAVEKTEIVMVEVEETYEEVEQRDTGKVRIVREAGDRYGIRPDQLAFWLIAAQAAIQSDLENTIAALASRVAALEAAK